MQVRTEVGPAGALAAAERGDVVILVDALRSSVSIAAALAAGARQVIPVPSVEEARTYLGRVGMVVAGEQGGVAVADFDYGNSPTQLLAGASRLRGRVLILATSNGTPLVRAAAGAAAVLAGSLPNARPVARAATVLARRAGCDVTLLAAGGNGRPVVEDDYAVAVLAREIAGQGSLPPDAEAQKVFAEGPNGLKLAALGYGADVALCARLNIFEEVGVLQGKGFVPWKTG